MKPSYQNTINETSRVLCNDSRALEAMASPALQALDAVQGLASPVKEEVFVRELLSALSRSSDYSDCALHLDYAA